MNEMICGIREAVKESEESDRDGVWIYMEKRVDGWYETYRWRKRGRVDGDRKKMKWGEMPDVGIHTKLEELLNGVIWGVDAKRQKFLGGDIDGILLYQNIKHDTDDGQQQKGG